MCPPPNNPSKPKHVNRKCSHQNCGNRIMQGGVCITHGAQRKCCAHPGCDKAVKLAGYCLAHGPSRQMCDHEGGCDRVARQGGRCLSHSARKRVCCYLGEGLSSGSGKPCGKHTKVGRMCKKHHDRMVEGRGMLDAVGQAVVCGIVGGGGGGGG